MKTWQILTVLASATGISCSQAATTAPSGPSTPAAGVSNAATSGNNAAGASSGSTQVASSGSTSTGGGGPTSSGSPVAGTNPSGATSSGSASSGSAASADAAVANDPNTVTLAMGDFVVPAGQEVFMCQDFDNPFNGVDVAIGQSESDMTEGSHHLHVFYGADSPPARTVTPCQNPFEFRSLLHVAGSPHLVTQYPPGMAAKLQGSLGLRLQ
jgi:hypothetical protein